MDREPTYQAIVLCPQCRLVRMAPTARRCYWCVLENVAEHKRVEAKRAAANTLDGINGMV